MEMRRSSKIHNRLFLLLALVVLAGSDNRFHDEEGTDENAGVRQHGRRCFIGAHRPMNYGESASTVVVFWWIRFRSSRGRFGSVRIAQERIDGNWSGVPIS